MRRIAVLVVAVLWPIAPNARSQSFRVTTWNLQWFPSGSQHSVSASVEEEHVLLAAETLKELKPDVVLLQEIRDWSTCDRLANALRPDDYHTLVCSAFRDAVGAVAGRQQVAILAKRWAQAAWSERWVYRGRVDPPRGFAFATIRYGDNDIAFYSVHLKSNLARGTGELEPQLNILKREIATDQLVEHSRKIEQTILPSVKHIVVGGDFNTNTDQPLFVSERTLGTLAGAGFKDVFTGLLPFSRITHPGSGRYPDATFDYLFFRNLQMASPAKISASALSDHRPVTCDFELLAYPGPK
jgi:endonuclease/exonuclease/phosphatase family metal-dependent hydrolase